jgi:hypothetical protein
MGERFHTIRAQGISVTIDLTIGHLRDLRVERDGREVAPLHLVPWADDPDAPREADTGPNLLGLGGDFLCAPFGANDLSPAPSHGWTANSTWTLESETPHRGGGKVARFILDHGVFGARVVKELILRDGHPFLYQRHLFTGGEGAITAAHHVNTAMPEGGRLSFSPKAYADIPDTPLEADPSRGRYVLQYPARTADLSALPLKGGGTADLHTYPIGERHEDFLMLVEAQGRSLGWTAAARERERDLLLVLKDPEIFPVTLLWFSNGGRDYPPWNGRHKAVLGIEDARCWSLHGHAASIRDNPLSGSGVPTSFALHPDGAVELRHAIGAIPIPADWTGTAIDVISEEAGALLIRSADGHETRLPYDTAFVHLSSQRAST